MKSNIYYDANSQLLKLIRIDYNNLCENKPKVEKDKLIQEAFKRNSSLNKITINCNKYMLAIPHEVKVPTIIPFLFKKRMTNPSTQAFKQAQMYLEVYYEFKMVIDLLSKEELMKIFDEITMENVKKSIKETV
ncbi:hypothetical protein [Staphylococcus aureus]|uniref:hypothetical protein n=1 Tax=Staphylococcus aureus TaxID=1280 RepID=UPI00404B8094